MYKPTPSPALDYLKQFNNWVCQNGEKMPINCKTGDYAKWSKDDHLSTFSQCADFFTKNKNRIDGLHMCILIKKEMGITCVDLDHRPNPVFFDGSMTKWAYDIVSELNSYSELSRSDNGVHITAFGEISRSLGAKKEHGVEMYNHNKIWTITGKHIPFTPNTIENRQDQITALHKQYCPQAYIPQKVKNYQYSDSTPSTNQIADMLSFIPLPLGYEEWNSICMAVHSAYPDKAGFDLVMNWSSGSFKDGENEIMSMSHKWRSYNVNGGTGIGTLFFYAKQYGWSPPTREQVQITSPLEGDTKPVEEPEPEIVTLTPEEHKRLLDAEYWRGYHDGMTDAQRQSWLTTGIPDNVLDFVVDNFKLGFKPEKVDRETGEVENECLSVPYFQGDELSNIEYRPLNNGLVTYQVQTPYLYNTTEDLPCNHVCIFEDSIDSIKAWLHYGEIELGGDRLHFMALPKSKLSINCLDVLTDANYIYVVSGKVAIIKGRGLELLRSSARFIRLPMSTDETCKHVGANEFVSLLRSGVKW